MRYYCRRESAASALKTNLQVYSLGQAAKGWNDLEQAIAAVGYKGVDHFIERLAFILACLGLSLSQLLGQNSSSPEKDRIDQPGALLSKTLTSSHADQTTRRRLNSTFQEFIRYYDSVRHFGRNRDEKHYRTIDGLTVQKLARFCLMTLEVWDVVLASYRDDDQNDLREIRSISELVQFRNLAELGGESDCG